MDIILLLKSLVGKMELLLIDAVYQGEVKLDNKTLEYLKRYKSIALYAAVQFSSKLENVIKQLEQKGIKVVSSKPARTKEKYQILGCDIYHGNLNLKEDVDAYLHIGDGRFHPLALVLQQRNLKNFKEVVMYDPIAKKMSMLTLKDVEVILKKSKASLKLFLLKKNIGVILTTKPGQQQYLYSLKLKERYPDKEFYYFIDDNINSKNFENFPFIDVWVNTACPRIGLDDAVYVKEPWVNLDEALDAEKRLGEFS